VSRLSRIQVEPRAASVSTRDAAAITDFGLYEDEFGLFANRQPTRSELLAVAATLLTAAAGLFGLVTFLH